MNRPAELSASARSELLALRDRLDALEHAISAAPLSSPSSVTAASAQGAQLTETVSLLRNLLEGTSGTTGEDFFRSLVHHLALALNVRDAFVSALAGSPRRVRTLAYWSGGAYVANIEFDVEHTPCQKALAGDLAYYPERVARHFPQYADTLAKLGIEGYLAIPMTDRAGRVLGHLAAMDVKPLRLSDASMWVFKAFGARAATELARQEAEFELAESRARLAGTIDSAMDAIIGIDQQLRIRLFNQAAEEVFRCKAEAVVGASFEPFVSERFGQLIRESIKEFERSGWSKHYLWAEGLAAFRSDGQAFPVDVSLSPFAIGDERHVTLILRDTLIRLRAQRDLARLRDENRQLQSLINADADDAGMVAVSPAIGKVLASVEQVAPTDTTVLITGETGTGKELIARALHRASTRRDKPLVKVNCAALSPTLIESELLGHERGAFTGAHTRKLGRFELADGATLFLDEIGELSLDLQAKLLRVLQEGELERVGGTATIKVDVRLLAATNRDLLRCVEEGRFRSDLYYRLNVFPIQVPPLRERREDIEVLIHHFVTKFSKQIGRPIQKVSRATIDALTSYDWPGNVRELEHVIERAVILARGPRLELGEWQPSREPVCTGRQGFPTLEALEREHILAVLEATGWRVSGPHGAASVLGLKPTTLEARMKKLGIRRRTR